MIIKFVNHDGSKGELESDIGIRQILQLREDGKRWYYGNEEFGDPSDTVMGQAFPHLCQTSHLKLQPLRRSLTYLVKTKEFLNELPHRTIDEGTLSYFGVLPRKPRQRSATILRRKQELRLELDSINKQIEIVKLGRELDAAIQEIRDEISQLQSENVELDKIIVDTTSMQEKNENRIEYLLSLIEEEDSRYVSDE